MRIPNSEMPKGADPADPREEFRDLMRRVREGDEQAARALYDRYAGHIVRVVRRRLQPPLRARFDSSDFVQSVWAAFFGRAAKRHHFDGPEALVAFLARVTVGKVAGAYRRDVRAARRACTRERSLDAATAGPGATGLEGCLAAPGPTPSQEAVAREHWERLLAGQPPRVRRILALRREGHTHEEIARQLNLSTKSVQRLLRRLQPKPAG